MDAMYEKSILGTIECHELLGEHEQAKLLRYQYSKNKNRFQGKENEMIVHKNQVYEGTLVAIGWDRLDNVNQSSLFTQDDEDILLEHETGMRRFMPYLNQRVRIWGEISSTNRDGKKILVKKITRILGGFTKPSIKILNELGDTIIPAA